MRPKIERSSIDRQDPLCQAVEAAWKAGIVVVVAAGNQGRDNTYGEQGYGTITAPGNDPYVVTAGAMKTEATDTRIDDLIASYSSKGPTQIDHIVKPDLVAPGNQIVSLLAPGSTLASSYPGNDVKNSYYQSGLLILQPSGTSSNFFQLSGTSMAAAVVSGAAADLLEANPNLTPDQVKLLLMQSAYKTFPSSSIVSDSTGTYTDYYDIFTVGAGYLDISAALSSIKSVPSGASAMSPTALYDPSTGNVTLSYDASSIWSNPSLYGNASLWGPISLGECGPLGRSMHLERSLCLGPSFAVGPSFSLGPGFYLGAWHAGSRSNAHIHQRRKIAQVRAC